jgi:hypothetical protein
MQLYTHITCRAISGFQMTFISTRHTGWALNPATKMTLPYGQHPVLNRMVLYNGYGLNTITSLPSDQYHAHKLRVVRYPDFK